MTYTFQNSHIPAQIHMYVSTSWLLSFSQLFLTESILVFTYTHEPLYIPNLWTLLPLYFCYLSSCDQVKNCLFFNILVFVNFLSSTFVCTNCVVYFGTGTRSYILEKYSFLHKASSMWSHTVWVTIYIFNAKSCLYIYIYINWMWH